MSALARQGHHATKAGALEGQETCAKTVPESDLVTALGLALSEKQIPQIVENIEKRKQGMELLESDGRHRRQGR